MMSGDHQVWLQFYLGAVLGASGIAAFSLQSSRKPHGWCGRTVRATFVYLVGVVPPWLDG